MIAGRYRLTDLLSEHDGARFWRAEDAVLSRDVAVHVVPGDDPRAGPMLDAARLAAVVHDTRLLRVLDADETTTEQDEPYAYVVHEWGQGRSVDLLLLDGPLSPRRAAWLVKEVAECLAACHVQGIAHGRLVPENVLINDAGGVKLIGFVVDASLHPGIITWPLTGQELQEHEADMVNLASLLYAALTGRWPGTPGTDVPEAPGESGRVLRPRQVRAGVPRPLDRICSQVLSGPEIAVLTAHDVASRLADYVGDPTPSEPTLLQDPVERRAYAWTPAQDRDNDADPPARAPEDVDTAVGAPVFFDDDTAVGWSEGAPTPRGPGASSDDPAASGPAQSEGGGRSSATQVAGTPVDGVRPLFVDDDGGSRWNHPARNDDHGSAVRSMEDSQPSSASGSLWPLIDSEAPESSTQHSGRGWMRLAIGLTVLVVMVVAVLLAFNLGQRSSLDRLDPAESDAGASDGTSATATGEDDGAPGEPWPIQAAIDFDPQGSDGENPELTGDAIDGDTGTAWTSLRYENRPDLGGLKSGVGLVLDLGQQRPVSAVQVTLRGEPTDFQVLAAPGRGAVPDGRAGFSQVGQAQQAGAGRTTVEVAPDTTTRYVGLWFTSLPQVDDARYQVQVADVVVRR
ncbi:hypothetical protein KLP28_06835 [Nocardioidaceae bacterium]|nr:hypothetical protein KLP28_06835 [Nocardioidaceae bacterium]